MKLQDSGVPLRTYGQQEADIIPIISSITKYAVMIDDPKRIGYEMDKAIHLSKTVERAVGLIFLLMYKI